MKRIIKMGMSLAIALFMLGCAKQQTVKPAPESTPESKAEQPQSPDTKQETKPEVKIEFSTVYFDFDSYQVRDADSQLLLDAARVMRSNSRLVVRLEGHCDERGTIEYNLALGEKRANAVRDYLAASGVDAKQLKTVSYGKEKPAVRGSDEVSWARNRRVEFVVELK